MTITNNTRTKLIRALATVLFILFGSYISIVYLVKRPSIIISVEGESVVHVDASALQDHVRILSENFLPRNYYHPENLDKAANYIKSNFEIHNSDTNLQSYEIEGKTFSNVISNYGPDTKEIIIVGAHYDAYSSHPGADDNASGVAGILELGRLLSAIELSKRVVLVAYTCEEPPIFASDKMGSFVHANSIKDKSVRLMISLEMIGYFSEDIKSQEFPISFLEYLYPEKGNYIAVIGEILSFEASNLKNSINRYTTLEAYSINAPAFIAGVDFSDHRNYWALGYPAVMVTDTAFFRNKMYHKQTDTYDRLNYGNMSKVVHGVFKHLQNL